MSRDEIQRFLVECFPGEEINFAGCGTDSMAFKVGGNICRFPHKSVDVYAAEAAVVDAVRHGVSVPIPRIDIVSVGGHEFAVHKMITGGKWSWHKYSWAPRRQRNLARSYAQFLGELHALDTGTLVRRVPTLSDTVPYCDWGEISQWLGRFMTPGQMRCFARNYRRIVNAPVDADDMVFVHMGMKGANSVVDQEGNICGVFDFCNGGIYERWRDFVLPYLGRNGRLFRSILREYYSRTGRRPNSGRIADLAAIEFLWRRRLYVNGVFAPRSDHFIKKNLAVALARFHRLPKPLYWLIYARMSMYQKKRRGINA